MLKYSEPVVFWWRHIALTIIDCVFILTSGLGMILNPGADFWISLCWIGRVFFSFFFFFYLLSEFPENVMAVCCLFYWLAQLVFPGYAYRCKRQVYWEEEGRKRRSLWSLGGWGQIGKGDHNRFSANRTGNETRVGNLKSIRRSVGLPWACLLLWEEQPLGQQVVWLLHLWCWDKETSMEKQVRRRWFAGYRRCGKEWGVATTGVEL